jgi:7-carboxy-7-deazaguanine synthase
VEIFGPTVQGEGPYAGAVCHFLRLGGCDYRCSWCDTPHAVEPALVRQAREMTVHDVMLELGELAPAPMLVISGGNPALWRLTALVQEAACTYQTLAVETQGSVWRPWLARVDSLVVSPKPPSSGMATPEHAAQLDAFMFNAALVGGVAFKFVVFDQQDLDWAKGVHARWPGVPVWLSVGTDQDDAQHADVVAAVGRRYAWLCEAVAADPQWHHARVLPQLHVVAWGHLVGV